MKNAMIALCCAMLTSPVFAQKACEELKSEIDAKIKAKGVKEYSLTIVANADVKEEKVVGSCEGGTKKIVYKRG